MIKTLAGYNYLWSCLRPFLLFYLGWRSLQGKESQARRGERLGRLWQKARPKSCLIWLHAVSVGESVAAISLAKACLNLHATTPVSYTHLTLPTILLV